MFNSLRTIFASSTQRFLNYEMGCGNMESCKKVFNISLQINTFVSIAFFILVEMVGLWFVSNQINVPEGRMVAVHWLLQLSIASAIISIFTTSFDALIIAHERMDFYAYMSIIEGLLRLFIAVVIGFYGGDKLILYGLLVMATGILVLTFNFFFCRLRFVEAHFQFLFDKGYLLRMTKFAGWNFFGNTAFALTQNGMNMVLNVFGGPVVNAARGITYQVNGALSQVINNIGIVINPFMIKTYAEGNVAKSFQIIYLSSKIYFTIQLCLVTFFTFFANEIIQFWLGQTPPYVIPFLTILLWYSLVRSLHISLNTLFMANGNLKKYQLCEGIVLSIPVIASYLLLRCGLPYTSVFFAMLFCEIVNMVFILKIAQKQCGLSLSKYFSKVVKPCLVCMAIYILCCFLRKYSYFSLIQGVLLSFFCVTASMSLMYFIGLDQTEKDIILHIVRDKNNENH